MPFWDPGKKEGPVGLAEAPAAPKAARAALVARAAPTARARAPAPEEMPRCVPRWFDAPSSGHCSRLGYVVAEALASQTDRTLLLTSDPVAPGVARQGSV